MKDERKTKKQLIEELREARERLAALDMAADKRERLEEALPNIEERYRLVVENSADVIYIMNMENEEFTYISPAVKRLFGYTSEEALTLNIKEILTPQSYEEQLEAMREALLKGGESTGKLQLQIIQRDGNEIPIEIHAGFIFDESGKPVEILGIARDITERKRAEEELRRSEEKYRSLVENLNEVVFTLDRQGRVTYISPNVGSLAGYLPEEIVGRRFIDFVHPEDYTGRIENFGRVLAGENLVTEYRYLTKSQGVKWVRTNASPFFENGEAAGLQGVLVDITELKHMQEQLAQYSSELEQRLNELQAAYERLEELDKMKDSFLSTVSHELRAPLTSIRSFAEILLTYEGDRKVQEEFLNIISDESERLTRLINDFLDLSKIESGRIELYSTIVEIPEVIDKALAANDALLKGMDMNLEVEVEPDLRPVWCDRDRLIQVVTNLINNAAKFTPSGGNIKVRAELYRPEVSGETNHNKMVKVSVIDNGIGISHENQETVFDKFAQVGDTLADKPRGSGLGLSICKEIVERYKGKIWIEGEPDKGSTFSFTIPLAQEMSGKGDEVTEV
ncbi:MAG: PAS domain-containing sensor histidine kinase [Dehalococcoidia bacterium]